MNRQTELELMKRLLAHFEAGTTSLGPEESHVPVAAYRSAERFEQERQVLFRGHPILVGHSSQLAAPGSFFTHDDLGVPLVFTRDVTGLARGFLNVCRHRGARVVLDGAGQDRKAFVCGYHGWSYNLDGSLLHIPHAEGFPGADCDRALVPIPVEEHAGFLWATATPRAFMDVRAYLGLLSGELDSLGLQEHSVYRSTSIRRRFNWKLIIDAFLDGYHLKQLHRKSVYRFFRDNVNIADPFSPHVRSVVARNAIEQLPTIPEPDWRLRDVLSLTYFLFPNTVLVFHPDWVSRITLFPLAVDETLFTHTMLVPREQMTEERRPHWDKTWALIHESVFEREDIAAAEWIQGGLDSGANEFFTCGLFEYPIRWFHDSLEQALASAPTRK